MVYNISAYTDPEFGLNFADVANFTSITAYLLSLMYLYTVLALSTGIVKIKRDIVFAASLYL